MESKDKFKNIYYKLYVYYFDYTVEINNVSFKKRWKKFLLDGKNSKIFVTFTTLLLWGQYHCVLGLIN